MIINVNGIDSKECSKCKEIKSINEFYISKNIKDGYQNNCKKCALLYSQSRRTPQTKEKARNYMKIYRTKPDTQNRIKKYLNNNKERISKQRTLYTKKNKEKLREKRLLRKFGLSIDEYNRMTLEQNNCCKICNRHAAESNFEKLSVDHNHKTGKVRGLLCNKCNAALGLFMDDATIINSALNYLKVG